MFQKQYLAIPEQVSGKQMDFHTMFEVLNRVQVQKEFPPKNDC